MAPQTEAMSPRDIQANLVQQQQLQHHQQLQQQMMSSLPMNPPTAQHVLLASPPLLPADSKAMSIITPMSFRQAMDSQIPHLHLMEAEQQQREQLLQMQQQQHLLAGAMPVSELTLQQSAILIQEQINAQSRSHTPIIPSQQPNNQPRGIHRQTPSFDGHIQPNLDIQALNAQIHQQRQHAHDMMTVAMVTSQQALLSPIEGGMNLIMPTAQNMAGLQGPRITTNIQERDSSVGFSVMSPGTHPPIELA
ncbi:hypothetical protein BGZ92_006610 [Podila epicladia]|nr:hypothetical protein BGZ92_006610 [Podila epicladia]